MLRIAMIASMLDLISKRFWCASLTSSCASAMKASFSGLGDFHTSCLRPLSRSLSIALRAKQGEEFGESGVWGCEVWGVEVWCHSSEGAGCLVGGAAHFI